MSILYSYGAQSLFLWQETDYWWFPVFLVLASGTVAMFLPWGL